jgi:hypothetical protein
LSALADALLADLDDAALDALADLLAPRWAARLAAADNDWRSDAELLDAAAASFTPEGKFLSEPEARP